MSIETQPASNQIVTDIRPDRGWLDLDLGAVWRFLELLTVLVMRDLQVLYKQALLGAGWAVLRFGADAEGRRVALIGARWDIP